MPARRCADHRARLGRSFDIASLAYSSLAIAVENAHLDDLRIIADGFQDGHEGYASSIPYMVANDGGIRTIEDLKGKALAVNAIGTAVDIGGRAVLSQHGLKYPGDYSIVEGPFPALGAMMLQAQGGASPRWHRPLTWRPR